MNATDVISALDEVSSCSSGPESEEEFWPSSSCSSSNSSECSSDISDEESEPEEGDESNGWREVVGMEIQLEHSFCMQIVNN